ncbi:gypsy retrotransposon integrase-like protein 1 [Plakobranchus ocellatus]|uniref:Gypsy retrotransposon integrase-like protein 1 n=1 Tax=Plakobranchus ocellatus TaxID=259542 RepID=A0AAV4E1R5_9GAST|nr:gypsy retrotransposon integrase-like protein 1 [Plakobranchus ocellatus]
MEVTDDLQSEVEGGMLKLASGNGEVKALCIPDAICDVIVGNVEGARSSENPDMFVMVGAATTRAQAKREAVTKPLRVPDIERHVGVDRVQLIKLQQEDPRILALVDAGRTSRGGGKIVSFVKARGIVYRRYQDLGRNVDVKKVVPPKPLREYVMSVAHDSITGAHLGIRRTKDKVLSNFYWSGVDGDVTRYCRSCDVCQRTVKKATVPRVPLEKVPLIDTPFKRVAIGLVGPIKPPSEAGHRFILTLVDYATRFAEAVPLRKIDTESVAGALVDIYSRLGVPEEVLSDQGTQFISDCMKEVCRLLGIKQKTTTPYHPMCNGLVERFNATLKTCLRRLCSEQPRQWHRYINPLLFAYREVPQESTHFAPFELLYGRTVRGPMHIDTSQATTEERPPTSSWAIPAASVTVIEDLGGEHFNDSDCEALPETVNYLKYGDELTLDQRRQLEEVAVTPKTKREVRAFLGLVGYYKEFVPNIAAVSAPLSDLVRKGQPNIVNWGDSQERAYNSLKVAVTSKPVLQLPDVNKRFVLRTDGSNRGLGAALMQENEALSHYEYDVKRSSQPQTIVNITCKPASNCYEFDAQQYKHTSKFQDIIIMTLKRKAKLKLS